MILAYVHLRCTNNFINKVFVLHFTIRLEYKRIDDYITTKFFHVQNYFITVMACGYCLNDYSYKNYDN